MWQFSAIVPLVILAELRRRIARPRGQRAVVVVDVFRHLRGDHARLAGAAVRHRHRDVDNAPDRYHRQVQRAWCTPHRDDVAGRIVRDHLELGRTFERIESDHRLPLARAQPDLVPGRKLEGLPGQHLDVEFRPGGRRDQLAQHGRLARPAPVPLDQVGAEVSAADDGAFAGQIGVVIEVALRSCESAQPLGIFVGQAERVTKLVRGGPPHLTVDARGQCHSAVDRDHVAPGDDSCGDRNAQIASLERNIDTIIAPRAASLVGGEHYDQREIVEAERRAILGPYYAEIVARPGTGNCHAVRRAERAIERFETRVAATIGVQLQTWGKRSVRRSRRDTERHGGKCVDFVNEGPRAEVRPFVDHRVGHLGGCRSVARNRGPARAQRRAPSARLRAGFTGRRHVGRHRQADCVDQVLDLPGASRGRNACGRQGPRKQAGVACERMDLATRRYAAAGRRHHHAPVIHRGREAIVGRGQRIGLQVMHDLVGDGSEALLIGATGGAGEAVAEEQHVRDDLRIDGAGPGVGVAVDDLGSWHHGVGGPRLRDHHVGGGTD